MKALSLLSCLVASVLALVVTERTFAQSSQSRPHVPGELLIGFETDQDRDQLIENLDQARSRLRARGEAPAGLTVERRSGSALSLRVEFPENVRSRLLTNPEDELALLEELARQLKTENRKIKYAHPNWIRTLNLPETNAPRGTAPKVVPQATPALAWPNDPIFAQGKHWHYMAPPTGMNAFNAWKAGNTGSREVVVAVLDTGLVFDHPDIKNSKNFLPGQNMLTSAQRRGDASDTSVLYICASARNPKIGLPNFHGTHVAGTVGAVGSNNSVAVAGVNWNVTVLPVRVLGTCSGTVGDEADGIRWAAGLPVEGLPRNTRPAKVINLSLGSEGNCADESNSYEREALAAARAAGVIVVVAAGNEKQDIAKVSPASCEGVISVAASDRDGKLAFYSNFGAVTIMAPGGDTRDYDDPKTKKPIPGSGEKDGIFSVVKATDGNRDGVRGLQGTSMAAPHAAGAIAMALAKHPDWRVDQVAEKLRASAFKLAPGACPKEKPCGPGLLDVVKLINQ
jgi:subtilisin family serine protease